MKKQKIQLAVLLAALLLLAAAIPGVKYMNEKREAKAADAAQAEEDSKVIIDVAYEDIIKLAYDYEDETYTFEKKDGVWYAAEDHTLNIQEYSIKGMLTGLTPFAAQQVIENVTDFSQYGLEQPQRSITFETASASHILYVGDHNALTGTYYICMPSESKVYVVEQTVVTRFNKTVEDVTEVSTTDEPAESAED